ncbi:SMP-30/gluconolactonase/LRE family protein [Rhizobium sp.]|uniref:SMP-30/gluconolactonase/LRE family protein n=1 Tax=Rhizobium sp. TaxID=391 RepID=UPI0028B0E029
MLDPALPLCQLGEGAHWDRETSSLWWVDILGKTIHRHMLLECRHDAWAVSKEVSFVFPRSDGRLLIGLSDGVYVFDPENGKEAQITGLDLPHDHRLNDGKFDPAGRLWVGTINTASEPSETAALYILRDDHLEEIEGGYVNANGKAWSADGTLMFHADTSRDSVWIYDFDPATSSIENKRVFAKTHDGSPDGLEAGADGRVYAAIYGGSRVDVFSSRGEVIDQISVPAANVTSCCLGGADNNELFITTAFEGMSEEDRRASPLAGQVFVASLRHDAAI